ncbi:hypothetical protein [Planomonospora venezuelensis]|uniref:Uncharacterized protein n=1 Tax=Planomonospora venezuelensis TaxID=1999 RepID=A0A841DAE8_PLAVE|nr:hypothetical protein [Planomonospora venezuelensis]MBB5967151.1 hypothetical protein [Planomonospora venezuelensis]
MIRRARRPSSVVTLPNSGTLIGPLSVNSLRVAFTIGTCNAVAAHRSGRRTSAPPMGMPSALAALAGQPPRTGRE